MKSTDPRHFIEFGPSMRVLIEDAIESLILLLDEIDGDDDFEDDPDREDDDLAEHDHCDLPVDYGELFKMDQSPLVWRCVDETPQSVAPVKEL
jgi:hypothetical protein